MEYLRTLVLLHNLSLPRFLCIFSFLLNQLSWLITLVDPTLTRLQRKRQAWLTRWRGARERQKSSKKGVLVKLLIRVLVKVLGVESEKVQYLKIRMLYWCGIWIRLIFKIAWSNWWIAVDARINPKANFKNKIKKKREKEHFFKNPSSRPMSSDWWKEKLLKIVRFLASLYTQVNFKIWWRR